jgi:transposase InsO family protein
VATWTGFVHVAARRENSPPDRFLILLTRRRLRPRSGRPSDRWRATALTVGWRVSRSRQAEFVLDALEQAVHDRRPAEGMGLVHHSDRGSRYVSIKYTERLAEAGIAPSVGGRHCA